MTSWEDVESPRLCKSKIANSQQGFQRNLASNGQNVFRWQNGRSPSTFPRIPRSCSKPRHFYFKANTQKPWRVKLVLGVRRWRRSLRPHYANLVRLLFVLYVLIDLKNLIAQYGKLDNGFETAVMHEQYTTASGISHRTIDYIAGFIGLLSALCFACMQFEWAAFRCMLIYLGYRHTRIQDGSGHPFQEIAQAACHLTALWFAKLLGKRVRLRMTAHDGILRYKAQANSLYNVKETDIVEAAVRFQASILLIDFSLTPNKLGVVGQFSTLIVALLFLLGYFARRVGKIVAVLLIAFSLSSPCSSHLGFTFQDSIPQMAGTLFIVLVGPGMLSIDDAIARSQCLVY